MASAESAALAVLVVPVASEVWVELVAPVESGSTILNIEVGHHMETAQQRTSLAERHEATRFQIVRELPRKGFQTEAAVIVLVIETAFQTMPRAAAPTAWVIATWVPAEVMIAEWEDVPTATMAATPGITAIEAHRVCEAVHREATAAPGATAGLVAMAVEVCAAAECAAAAADGGNYDTQ